MLIHFSAANIRRYTLDKVYSVYPELFPIGKKIINEIGDRGFKLQRLMSTLTFTSVASWLQPTSCLVWYSTIYTRISPWVISRMRMRYHKSLSN